MAPELYMDYFLLMRHSWYTGCDYFTFLMLEFSVLTGFTLYIGSAFACFVLHIAFAFRFFFFHLKHMHSFPTVQQFCSKTSQGSRFTKSLISSSLTKKVVSSSRSLGNNIGWSTQNIGREGSMSAEWRICWQRIDFHQLVTIPFDFFFGKVP